MPFIETPIRDLIVFEPKVWKDDRGYFYESYNQAEFEKGGIQSIFVQDNQAFSSYGVLRGLHYQTGEHSQAKLVRCISGSVYDVAVDLREGSPTFGEWFGIELNTKNHLQLFVPRGFAHGYLVTSPTAIFCYKCDNLYNKSAEGGLIFNDPTVGIDWKIDLNNSVLSPKDVILPTLDAILPTGIKFKP